MTSTYDTNHERRENNMRGVDGDDRTQSQVGEKVKTTLASSSEGDRGEKTEQKVGYSNPIKQTDNISSAQSINETMNSSVPSAAFTNSSDTDADKKDQDKTTETTKSTQHEEESVSTSVSSYPTDAAFGIVDNTETSSTSNTLNTKSGSDSQILESKSDANFSTTNNSDSNPDTKGFSIEKGDSKYLTDFQRQKAQYFFNVNLDIENKEYVTWQDVEFYLLFHETAAGKEGSDGGDLEARLSRAARSFWEFVHDQIPSPDKTRDTLTLDQFLDTWASLIDYVVRTNQLPPIVQDLVKLGFELYSTESNREEPATISLYAFEQLFQNTNLERKQAIIAFGVLTEGGKVPLNADKIESLVKAALTSSDDDHSSHFLLPGFYKQVIKNKNKEENRTSQTSSPTSNTDPPPVNKEASPIPSPPPVSQSQSAPSPTSSSTLPKASESSPTSSDKPKTNSATSDQPIPNSTLQTGAIKSPPSGVPNNPRPNVQVPLGNPKKTVIQTEDENIRRLLQFYRIDDGDFVEVAGGSVERVVLLHPERPLPPYIQQNPKLLEKLQNDSSKVSPVQQCGLQTPLNKVGNNGTPLQQRGINGTKPKTPLEERLQRGEVRLGPTVPLRQDQKQGPQSASRIRQVYPPLSEAQQLEQQRQARLQASQTANVEKKSTGETTTTTAAHEKKVSEKETSKGKQDLTAGEQEKLVSSVLKQLTPIVQKRIAEELQRIQSGEADQDDDDDDGGFIPFPFMFAPGGNPFFAAPRKPSQSSRVSDQQQQQPGSDKDSSNTKQQQQDPDNDSLDAKQQQQDNMRRGPDFGGFPPGAGFLPPPLFMTMINDLAMGAMGGEMPMFPPNMGPMIPPNMPPPPRGPGGMPGGLGGFMMFVDDHPMMGGRPGPPPRPGPRF